MNRHLEHIRKKNLISAAILVFSAMRLFSQETQKHFSFDGYISTLQSAMFDSVSGPVL